MPIYVFKCLVCEDADLIEKLQSYEAPGPTCGACGTRTTRQIAGSNFSLKGEGWASSNYGLRSEPRKPTNK